MTAGMLDPFQRHLLAWLEDNAAPYRAAGARRGWRYPTQFDLLLDEGRWFAPPTHGDADPNAAQICYAASTRLARRRGLAYVEGYALAEVGESLQVMEHAWCSTTEGVAVDPAWGAGGGKAYLGIAITEAFRALVTRRARCAAAIHACEADRFRLLEHGLPPDAVLDLGIPAVSR
ncbi:hypothetical protein DMP23_43095 [Amycolatopsis sp. A1MSW2902]|uniref:hypothetical protein n=1 Tax=Amycolatopsis sp. A1MSW2902 TaxID=687413 RepID=UPI00307DE2A4